MKELNTRINHILKSIEEVEEILNEEEFQEYCDNAHTCITYLEKCKNKK